MTTTLLRILLADDHAIVREGLTSVISRQGDMQVVGQATNGQEAVALALTLLPDVILLDLMMPIMDGLEAIRAIRQSNEHARILVLTSFANDSRVFPAIKAGALGYLLKDATHDQLLQAIRDVAQGRASLHPAIALKVMREIDRPAPDLPPTPDPLTAREMDTLRLIARGLTNQEIAAELGIHERTVVKYVTNIFEKLHLANRTQAALYALRQGLAELQPRIE
jgi:NarL family two-component system response regulator LiaR